ncbi:MAG: type II toxin-antitoxin system VapC family toxin [Vicinamibacteria bacterium]|nr:type II toxin-antitoxin system VapC family toxin [Vicinamibacteria bacterium]
MILIDANILLYAYHPKVPEHKRAAAWLESVLAGKDPVGLPWMTIWAFIRIITNAHVFERPLRSIEAVDIVSAWLSQPTVVLLEPGERHWEVLQRLLVEAQVSGPLVSDAVLAALAIEHGAVLCTTDRDFSRFPQLKTANPLAE